MYPEPPEPPKPGEKITDTFVKAIWTVMNEIYGIATTDRHNWTGENDCLRGLQKAGQIR